jgi:hypothetical protein
VPSPRRSRLAHEASRRPRAPTSRRRPSAVWAVPERPAGSLGRRLVVPAGRLLLWHVIWSVSHVYRPLRPATGQRVCAAPAEVAVARGQGGEADASGARSGGHLAATAPDAGAASMPCAPSTCDTCVPLGARSALRRRSQCHSSGAAPGVHSLVTPPPACLSLCPNSTMLSWKSNSSRGSRPPSSSICRQ